MRNSYKTGGWTALVLFWIFFLKGALATVSITDLDVPDYFQIGENESHVILRCEYKLGESSKPSFVLKWFKDDVLVYQWITGHKPIVLAHMKDQIDPTYEESANELSKYSSLFIKNVNVKNSGNYKCVVTSADGHDVESAYLQVIDTSQDYSLDVAVRHADNHTEIVCTANNIYPEPTLLLWEDNRAVAIKTHNVDSNGNGLFTVRVTGIVGDDDDDADDDGVKDDVDDDDDNDGVKDHIDDDDDNDGIKDDVDPDDDNDGTLDSEDDDNNEKDVFKCTLKIPNTDFSDEDTLVTNSVASLSPLFTLIVTLAGLTINRF